MANANQAARDAVVEQIKAELGKRWLQPHVLKRELKSRGLWNKNGKNSTKTS